MKLNFNDTPLDISSSGKSFVLSWGEKTIHAEVVHAEAGRLDLLIDGKRIIAHVSSEKARYWVTLGGQTFVLTKASGTRRGGHGHAHAAGELLAPMPGQIRAVNVGEGDAVTRGQTLLVLEAMKMEIRIQAPADGVVKKLFVDQGQTVEREQILVEVDTS